MKFAYADPPYVGCAHRYYREHEDYRGEVDHRELLGRLYEEFPDGWALSASSSSLWHLVPMIPPAWRCRIGAWCRPFSILGAHNGQPRYAWEAVVWRGGRLMGEGLPPMDWLIANGPAAEVGHRSTNKPGGRTVFRGSKPAEFCYWVFELLGMREGDELVDLYPGSGRVTRAWEAYRRAKVRLFVGG